MAKIAYNGCYGGFGLSEAGVKRYAEIKGVPNAPDRRMTLARNDPALIQVIEEMGEEANGDCAYLLIAEIPDGSRYRIDEYDGNESVMLIDDYEWQVA